VTLVTGQRVLVMAQTSGQENGIYDVPASGAASRSADADTAAEITSAAVFVTQGTTYHDKMYVMNTDNVTLNTTSLTWAEFGGGTAYTAGNGLQLVGSAFSVVADTGISVSGSGVAVNHSTVPFKYAADCAATTNPQTFAHGLGAVDLLVQTILKGSPNEIQHGDVTWDGTNIYVNWGAAPSAAEYRVIAHG
jgi:hypothetical protein